MVGLFLVPELDDLHAVAERSWWKSPTVCTVILLARVAHSEKVLIMTEYFSEGHRELLLPQFIQICVIPPSANPPQLLCRNFPEGLLVKLFFSFSLFKMTNYYDTAAG